MFSTGTTDLQYLKASRMSGGIIKLTCEFITGSVAEGCLVDVRVTTPTEDRLTSVIIHRNEGDNVVTQEFMSSSFDGMNISVNGYDYNRGIGMVSVKADVQPIPGKIVMSVIIKLTITKERITSTTMFSN